MVDTGTVLRGVGGGGEVTNLRLQQGGGGRQKKNSGQLGRGEGKGK